MPQVAVVTDSAACVPSAVARQHGIEIVPFQLVWDGQTFLDGIDLAPEVFYQRFRTSSSFPTTATPTVGQFVAAYQRALARADSVVVVMLPESLTSAIVVARQAADLLAQQCQAPIGVVDSGTATSAEGFVVLAAARAAQAGASLEQVVAVAQAYRERVGVFFAIETLEHLRRGGRIGRAATLLGARLSIQPVLTLADGQVQPVAVRRSRRAAVERLVVELRRVVQNRPIRADVSGADVPQEVQRLAERVERAFNCVEVTTSEFTPVMGAHTGPGIIGISYCLEDVV